MLWLVRQKYDFYLYLQKESAIFARMEEDEKFMRMALSEAESACEAGEVPIGCVVVSRGRIISRGHNLTETLHDVTAHAEMQAITAAANSLGGKYLQGCTLYVTVEPCVMCAGAIGWDAAFAAGLWSQRREAWLFALCSPGLASPLRGQGGRDGGGVPRDHPAILQGEKRVEEDPPPSPPYRGRGENITRLLNNNRCS